jgi:hypothetical protein
VLSKTFLRNKNLVGAKDRALPTQSSPPSPQFVLPRSCPSPGGELRKPSSGHCTSDGQTPGEHDSLYYFRVLVAVGGEYLELVIVPC